MFRIAVLLLLVFVYAQLILLIKIPSQRGQRKQEHESVLGAGNSGVNRSSKLMDFDPTKYHTKYLFNCTNIQHITIIESISYGTSKEAFLGEYMGNRVAVKMVTARLADIKDCVAGLPKLGHNDSDYYRARCYGFPNMKLMREILLLQELSHPNLVRLLGFCIRGDRKNPGGHTGPEYDTGLTGRGVVAVYEYGEILHRDMLRYAPWTERLDHAVELASLLCYLAASPLGSLILHDFKPMHFLLVNKSIKVIDLDDVGSTEEECGNATDSRSELCDYGSACVNGYCVGNGAKHMLSKMNNVFFQILLLPVNSPERVVTKFRTLNERLHNLSINASELLQELTSIKKMPG